MTMQSNHVVASFASLACVLALVVSACADDDGPAPSGEASASATETPSATDDSSHVDTGSGVEPTTTDLATSGSTGGAEPTTAEPSGAASGETSSSATAGTTSGAIECEPQPYFQCSVPRDCDLRGVNAFACGHVSSYIDENGCPRPLCGEGGACPEGMRCHDSYAECGRCMDWLPGCGDYREPDGTIGCGCGGDGACGGWVCLPEDEFPLGLCDR